MKSFVPLRISSFASWRLRGKISWMRDQLIAAINANRAAFGIDLSEAATERLADYYELVLESNSILHLVGPCSPEEFAIRHILESLMLLKYLPKNARFADVGAGAGLPSIPCLIVREDLRGVLIESKMRKANFLQTAVDAFQMSDRAEVVNRQFEEVETGNFTVVTCRALDKLKEKLPRILKWTMRRPVFLFAGNNVRDELRNRNVNFTEILLPLSEQRFLIAIRP